MDHLQLLFPQSSPLLVWFSVCDIIANAAMMSKTKQTGDSLTFQNLNFFTLWITFSPLYKLHKTQNLQVLSLGLFNLTTHGKQHNLLAN